MFKDNLACIRKFVESDDKIQVMWKVGDAVCWVYGIFEMWDVEDVRCWGCEMLRMWDVRDMECCGCRMLWMWDVRDVGCLGYGMWDVECLPGCGMFICKMLAEYCIFRIFLHI